MGAAHRLLRRVLPGGTGQAALADLEREMEERRARRGARPCDTLWLMQQGMRVAARLRIARGLAGAHALLAGRGGGAPAGFASDLRVAVRGLVRRPLLALTAALMLALGVAAPTVMYSLARAIGGDVPLPESGTLVHVAFTSDRYRPGIRALPVEAARHLQENPPASGPVAGYAAGSVDLTGGGEPESLMAAWVTPDFFDVLRTPPLRGRMLVREDALPGASPVVLVGERLWTERFAGDPGLVGSTVRVDGTPRTVVGVVPRPVLLPSGAELWIPVAPGADPDPRLYYGVTRLPLGPEREGARAALETATAHALGLADVGAEPEAIIRPFREHLIAPRARLILAAMLSLMGLVLLIACANVANLLLARTLARRRELAVRVALGASRLRVAAQLFAEAAAVAVVGGAMGGALAVAGVEAARHALADELDWWMELRLDAGVLVFALLMVGAATLLAGLLPAFHAVRTDPDQELRGGARGGEGPRLSRLSRGLVVAEVTFSVAVLVVCGLMVKGAVSMTAPDQTREPRSIMVAAYTLPGDRFVDAAGRLAFHRDVVEGLAARPGIEGVALSNVLPGGSMPHAPIMVEGVPRGEGEPPANTYVVRVSPGLFDVLGAGVLRGRDLTWRDGAGDPPAVVVNEAFVRRHLPPGDPLGRRVGILRPTVAEPVTAVVVGVVPPLGVRGQDGREDALYLPVTVAEAQGAHILARAAPSLDARALLPDIRAVVRELDPDRPLHTVATLAEHRRSGRQAEWFFTGLFTVFGVGGLLMAAAGLYAVIAFAVGRRRREVGVRVALGAGPGRVLWTVTRSAVLQLTTGVTLGLALAGLAAPAFGPALMGSHPRDPSVYAAIALVVGLTGLAAALVPALRALRVRPMDALRVE